MNKNQTSKADKAFNKAMANSLFDQGPSSSKKKPVKFSDNMKEIMRAQKEQELRKMGIQVKSSYKPAKRSQQQESSLADFIQVQERPAPKKKP